MPRQKQLKKSPKPSQEKTRHPHAWRQSWGRPVEVDEKSLDAFTLARMTDHNVRGRAAADRGRVSRPKRRVRSRPRSR